MRERLGLHREPPSRATAADVIAFTGWYLASPAMGVVGLVGLPVMVALGLWGQWESRRSDAAPKAV